MDSQVARERISCVVKPDSITASQGDFLATHVAVGRLELLSRFEFMPHKGKPHTEEEVYESLVLNPENRHQFVAVYGQSGTGKSHLIRWFEARFRADKPENEVVLFIRRSDNTLKGTIRQLLNTPEVQEIADKEIFERLVKASAFEDESKLKGRIYYDFVNEVDNDEGERDRTLSNVQRKRLIAFLSNEKIREHLMSPDGPIERIYSKIAENSRVDRDTIAQFEAGDFVVSADMFDELNGAADPKAIKQARALMADEEGEANAFEIASYLNQFVNDVIQRCAGIQPGDFRDIFQDIRRELYRIGKSLTLFIEDVTSFTGVDDALLDALLVDHSGMNAAEKLCRISSFVGTTSNYLQNNFRDNHKDRITQYVYIPDAVFDEDGVYEFIARYLNAMSLPAEVIDEWADNGAAASSYPIHEVVEGQKWEFVEIEFGKKLCLYPFTKRSIVYYYNKVLQQGQQTPRYIIRDIIEPVVSDVLLDRASFPHAQNVPVSYDPKLLYRIEQEVSDSDQAARLMKFLTIWGDGSAYQGTIDGVLFKAGIREDIFQDFMFPEFTLLDHAKSESVSNNQTPSQGKEPDASSSALSGGAQQKAGLGKKQPVNDAARDKVEKALSKLSDWKDGKEIDVSSTGGVSGVLKSAQDDMCDFIRSSISWQAEGVSADNIAKIKDSARRLVTFENQAKSRSEGFYVLPANSRSVQLVFAFVRWRQYGSQSWNYDGADFDAYLVTSWLPTVKDAFVAAVNDALDVGVSYIHAAVASEVYREILLGGFKGESLVSLSIEHLFKRPTTNIAETGHCQDWKTLVNMMSQKGEDEQNGDTVKQYFNLRQGTTGGSVTVLDDPGIKKVLREVKDARLALPEDTEERKDSVSAREKVFKYYWKIHQRIERVVASEKDATTKMLGVIDTALLDEEFGVIDEDAIIELARDASRFYSEANKAKIPITSELSPDQLKRNAKQISNAIATARKAVDAEAPLSALMLFSGDPILQISKLVSFLAKLGKDVERASRLLDAREKALESVSGLDASTSRYAAELGNIDSCIDLFEEGSC